MFPDGHIRRVGVSIGIAGVARHSFCFYGLGDGDDDGWLEMRRDVSCVTAACLLTGRSHRESVRSVDAKDLAVAFDDVDFHLRLRSIDRRVVRTPQARPVPRESVSRGPVDAPEKRVRSADEEIATIERRGETPISDPRHDPNLSLVGAPFAPTGRPCEWTAGEVR